MNRRKDSHDDQGPNDEGLGLAAIGSSRQWTVAVDETTSGRQKWFMQIESPVIYLYFEIESPSVVAEMLRFLETSHPQRGHTGCPLRVGTIGRNPVTLIRDDEQRIRCFVAIGSAKSCVRLTLDGDGLEMLVNSLRQVKQELDSEDRPNLQVGVLDESAGLTPQPHAHSEST